MKKNLIRLLGAVCAVSLGAAVFTACASDEIPVHKHRFIDREAVAATCVDEGNIAYQECPYCGKFFVDGKEVEEKDLVTEIDSSNHKLTDVAAVAEKCVEEGMLAHQECSDCHKLFKNGAEVQKADVIVAPKGSHTFAAGSLNCSECDGYKLLYDGNYYVVDRTNYQPFVKSPAGAEYYAGTAATKAPYLADYPVHRMTMATQVGNVSSMKAALKNENWVLTCNKAALASFTRFAYGEESTPYIGKFLMTFDMTVSDASVEVQRIGVKVVDAEAVVPDVNTYQQAKLLGTNASEENNADRKLEANTVYRFAYEIELNDPTQLVQIFMCFGTGTHTVTLSNMHFINLDGATGRFGSTLLSFGKATDALTVKESCTHAWRFAVKEKAATCLAEGVHAHNYCPQCGARTDGEGNPATDVIISRVDHDYGELVAAAQSTCEVKGHSAYYRCAWCDKYFDESKAELEGLPELELAEHAGEWQSDAEKHWMHCSACDKDVNEAAHVPGPDATDTQPQKCTVCGKVLVPALGHTHTPGELVPAKTVTCTEDGNPAYYQCSDPQCGKYFSDEACTVEIPESEITVKSTGHAMETKVAAKTVTCTEDGNLAYYHCTKCDKYFADENGETDITETWFIAKLGHAMTFHAAVTEATCSEKIHVAYYSCANCKLLFSDEEGANMLDNVEFTGTKLAHNYNSENVCDTCGAKKTEDVVFEIKDGAKGNNNAGTKIKETLIANPGTWAIQYNDDKTTITIDSDNNVLKIEVPGNKNQRAVFIRFIPANDSNKAFIGAYRVSFDLVVTKSGTTTSGNAKMQVGFAIQNKTTTLAGDTGSNGEQVVDFEVGKTYHFAAYIETLTAEDFFQFTARNIVNDPLKGFEISNFVLEYESEAAKTGAYAVERIAFAEKAEAAAPAPANTEALISENKSEYAE